MCNYDFVKDTIVITNRHLVEGDYLAQISKVVSLNPRGLILREKDLSDDDYEALAREVLDICNRENVPCFIHSKFEMARRLGCENIHISAKILSDSGIEDELRPFKEISVACHSIEDVELAISKGATRIILGTIFETECKAGLKGRGCDFVREICQFLRGKSKVKVYAIGGIKPDNLRLVKAAGAAGGCMMSYMMRLG